MIIIFTTGILAIKCIFGQVAQACFASTIPNEAIMIAAGFELVFEYWRVKVWLKRFKNDK